MAIASTGEPLLYADNLVFRYPGAVANALDDFTMQVPRGQVFGLLGPNGAGKTTAISIMCTLMRPARGGGETGRCGCFEAGKKDSLSDWACPSGYRPLSDFERARNLHYFGRLHGLQGEHLRQRTEDCLKLVGLLEQGDRSVDTYSGGMKRRANLAVGIIHKPQLLFLDEPTVGIDAQSRNMIIENLIRLRESGMTMVYTTHYMEEAQQLCARIAIVDRGQVIAEGEPQRLVSDQPACRNLEELFLHLTGRQLRD